MEQEINEKLEELFITLDNSSLIKEIKILKQKVLYDSELMEKINKVKTLNKYDPSYKELKIEIYKNDNYRRYIEDEQKINFIIMSINSKFKKLIGDKHEDN